MIKGFVRGLGRRCAACGAGGQFSGYFTMVERCPRCGHSHEREEGMWVGALIVNMAAFLAVFLLVVVGGLALTWPDVPWTALTAVTVAVAVVVPVAFYPFSKSIWAAIELGMRPLEPEEQEAAESWLAARAIEAGADEERGLGQGADRAT